MKPRNVALREHLVHFFAPEIKVITAWKRHCLRAGEWTRSSINLGWAINKSKTPHVSFTTVVQNRYGCRFIKYCVLYYIVYGRENEEYNLYNDVMDNLGVNAQILTISLSPLSLSFPFSPSSLSFSFSLSLLSLSLALSLSFFLSRYFSLTHSLSLIHRRYCIYRCMVLEIQEATLKLQPECTWQFQTATFTVCKLVPSKNITPIKEFWKTKGRIWLQHCYLPVLNLT